MGKEAEKEMVRVRKPDNGGVPYERVAAYVCRGYDQLWAERAELRRELKELKKRTDIGYKMMRARLQEAEDKMMRMHIKLAKAQAKNKELADELSRLRAGRIVQTGQTCRAWSVVVRYLRAVFRR